MFYERRRDNHPGDEPITPTQCPECGSRKVTTTNKVVTISTYWRCEGCGEIWNAGRRKPSSRYAR